MVNPVVSVQPLQLAAEGTMTTSRSSQPPNGRRPRQAPPFLLAVTVASLLVASPAGADVVTRRANVPNGQAKADGNVLRILPDDSLTRSHLAAAVAGSATARDLIERIEHLPGVVLILRAHPMLVRQEGLLGRGKFWIVRGRLFGLLAYQAEPLGSRRALRIITHELAHALEVGLAPRGHDTESFRALVLGREASERQVANAAGIETEFARAVGYRVELELLGKLKGPSALTTVAETMHLALDVTRPSADPASTDLASLQ